MIGCLPELIQSKSSPQLRQLKKYIGWMSIILIGLSIPADKKMRYILPMAPALALIGSYLWSGLLHNNYLRILKNILNWFCFFIPIFALIVLVFLKQKLIAMHINYSLLVWMLVIMQCAMVMMRKREIVILGLAALTFVLINIMVVEKINVTVNKTKKFVITIESIRAQRHANLAFFQEGADGLPIKYVINMTTDEKPIYLKNPQELQTLKSPSIVIVGQENLSHIPQATLKKFTIISYGKIGHDGVIVMFH